MCKTSETPLLNVECLSGNIFHVVVKDNADINLAVAHRLIAATNELMEVNNPFRAGIYDISGINTITDDARQYLSTTNDIKGTVVGVALISSTFLGKMVGNLFITLGGHRNFPIQYFDSVMRAEHWIRKQMSEAIENNADDQNKDVA